MRTANWFPVNLLDAFVTDGLWLTRLSLVRDDVALLRKKFSNIQLSKSLNFSIFKFLDFHLFHDETKRETGSSTVIAGRLAGSVISPG